MRAAKEIRFRSGRFASMQIDLTGKRALVTGANSGLGEAIAREAVSRMTFAGFMHSGREAERSRAVERR